MAHNENNTNVVLKVKDVVYNDKTEDIMMKEKDEVTQEDIVAKEKSSARRLRNARNSEILVISELPAFLKRLADDVSFATMSSCATSLFSFIMMSSVLSL